MSKQDVAWRPLALVAGIAGLFMLAFSVRYGFHRDELYYLAAGDHLAWGYDDQPPMVALWARIATELAGGHIMLLRLPATRAVAGLALLTGLITAELGGGKGAQVLAAVAMVCAPVIVIAGHLLSTTILDIFLWTLLAYLLVRWINTRGDHFLYLAGPLIGFALLTKTLVLLFLAGLAVGVIVAGPRELLRRKALWISAGIALVLWAPNLYWQATHGWPQLGMTGVIAEDADWGGRVGLIPMQAAIMGGTLAVIWIAGLWRLLRTQTPFRLFAIAYLTVLLLTLITGGREYYPAGAMPVLVASGAIATIAWLHRVGKQHPETAGTAAPPLPTAESTAAATGAQAPTTAPPSAETHAGEGLAAGGAGSRGRKWLLAGAFALSIPVTVVMGVPFFPMDSLGNSPQPAINYDAGEQVGWPELARNVAAVFSRLPEADRAKTTIVTGNYGQAGALYRYGPPLGLPQPYSGHLGFWHWGPPPEVDGPVIIVGRYSAGELLDHCTTVELAARHDNGFGVGNEEQGVPIWLCQGRKLPWAQLWPPVKASGLKHLESVGIVRLPSWQRPHDGPSFVHGVISVFRHDELAGILPGTSVDDDVMVGPAGAAVAAGGVVGMGELAHGRAGDFRAAALELPLLEAHPDRAA